MVKKYNNFLHIILFFVFLSFLPQKIHSQCAGVDTGLTVCDILNPANKSINLFALLGPTASGGGIWSDDDNTGGLSTTGILNVHLIRQSGIYRYTYTVTGVNGCADNSSTVTVTIGGYAGKPSPTATVCSDDVTFNLFQAFDSAYLSPHSNGQWHDDNTNQNINGSFINVKTLEGTYQYTYTMPARGTCPAPAPSTVFITVIRAPESGSASTLSLCANDGLSAFTNYDLFNLISGQDPEGTWGDYSNTGELNFKGDHTIDIENIYKKYGANRYVFYYEVKSPNPICPVKRTSVVITVEEKLDFTGAILVINSDICESEILNAKYSATITRGPANIPDGNYFVTYSVSGPNAAIETIFAAFTNGVLRFPFSAAFFQQVGTFNVKILGIYANGSSRVCTNIINNLSDDLIIYPDPDLSYAIIKPIATCQNKEVLVQISNAVKLTDGDYNIIYNLTGANNVPSQVAQITMSGGNASFVIPEIFNSRNGNSIITITAITNLTSQCVKAANLKGDILTNPLPNGSALRLQIPNVCFGKDVPVTISGLQTLTNITLSYILSGSNTSSPQIVILTAADGNSNFILPSNLLTSSGSTTFSVTNLKNNSTTCDIDVTGVTASFILNPIPDAPVASNQVFCKVDDRTVADLEPKGAQYKWYISAAAVTPLAGSYILKSEDYFIKETSTAGCVSEPSKITVTIQDTPAPILNQDGQNFCGLDNPTILNLSNNTNSPSTVVWYDAAVNGNLLPSSSLLTDRTTYYGFDFSTTVNCFSEDYLAVTVSLIECDSPEYSFFIPDGFSPNGDGINDSFIIPDIDFLYPNYTLDIYNRYGNGMYKGYKNKPGWDGKNYESSGVSGGIAPNGVYFYILNFNKDNKPPKQGRLYLNR